MAEPVPSGSGITAVILIFFYTPCYVDEKFYRDVRVYAFRRMS